MRISDWSSDVCSSDLRDRTVARARRTLRRARRTHPPAGRREPQPAPAARTAGRRTLAVAGEERAGTFARRGDDRPAQVIGAAHVSRSEEHTSELQSLMRISYAVFCLKKKKRIQH